MTSTRRNRADQDWVADLASSEERSEAALAELRGFLMAGLRRAFPDLAREGSWIEDFAQDALLRIREKLGSYRGDSRFLTWAMSIGIRTAISELRRARWRDVSLDQMAEAGQLVPAAGQGAAGAMDLMPPN
jgi:RNA polymerase sigma-70 factor (ECF subfamily)